MCLQRERKGRRITFPGVSNVSWPEGDGGNRGGSPSPAYQEERRGEGQEGGLLCLDAVWEEGVGQVSRVEEDRGGPAATSCQHSRCCSQMTQALCGVPFRCRRGQASAGPSLSKWTAAAPTGQSPSRRSASSAAATRSWTSFSPPDASRTTRSWSGALGAAEPCSSRAQTWAERAASSSRQPSSSSWPR